MSKKPENARKSASTQILTLPIGEIRPYEKNPRKNADAVKFVKASIEQFGFKVPIIVDSNRVIVCGHTRLMAAKSLGMSEVPCIFADDLTDDQIKAFRLADNKVGEFAEWDMDLLGDELDAIAEACDIDMGDFGFDLSDDDEETEVVEDEVPEDVEPVCKKGDVWLLGEHRLMCGDSTDSVSVDLLMNGQKADISFFSPPYNAGFGANLTKDNGRSKYTNGDDDNKTQDEYAEFLQKTIDNANNNSKFTFCNIQMLANNKSALFSALTKHFAKLADIIIWDKGRSQPAAAANVLNSEFEFVFVFSEKANRNIGTVPFHGTLKNIVHISPSHNEYAEEHNAVFPIELAAHFVQNFAKDSVLDLFGGTGTTMIAAEQLGRKCFMMELDPHYCDVIIARWEQFTGKKAIKVEA